MEEKEIKRLLRLAVKKELSIQDVTDAILSLHSKDLANFRQPDVSARSELLLNFANKLNNEFEFLADSSGLTEYIDDYLKGHQ
jgi:hypothetical protein